MADGKIRFLRSGRVVEHAITNPTMTVLDYLRLEEKSRGTKEGCNEGDCGACTVALGRLRGDRVFYEPANACIMLMGHLHCCELVTVDDLDEGGILHPVQNAMVEAHASQCGFCTPGFVMSLFTLYHSGKKVDRQTVVDQIAGNLCRCTGYRPIIDAALQSCSGEPTDPWAKRNGETAAKLAELWQGDDVFCGDKDSFTAVPVKGDTLFQLAHDNPDATLVAGATDAGLWITKQFRPIKKIIHLGHVPSFHAIASRPATLSLGCAVTYAEAEHNLAELSPDVAETLRRLGSKQVRSLGTIGGNLANGSPIGDMAPMLIALGARVNLRHGNDQRMVLLEKFYLDYGKQDRNPGEVLWRVDIPRLDSNERFFAHKISKRNDQDISAVMAAFKIGLAGRKISSARLAFGGMAGIPKRASNCESLLVGCSLDAPESWEKALEALEIDFTPLSDMRATAQYRMETAQNLIRKALDEIAGASLVGTRLNVPHITVAAS